MQKIAPHTLPPNAKGEGTRNRSDPTAQPVPAAMQLARRIRREQGIEQVRRFLIAMEPFLAPYERMAIAEHMGIRLPPPQSPGGQMGNHPRPMNQPNTQGSSSQGQHTPYAAQGGCGPTNNMANNGPVNNAPMNNPTNSGPMGNNPMGGNPMNNNPMNNNPMNNNPMGNMPLGNAPMNAPMNPQMQMLNMLGQMSNATQSGFNPMMLAQMMGNLGMGNFRK